MDLKNIIVLVMVLSNLTVVAQCRYPDATSANWKPMWLTDKMPRNGARYYYDKGYGVGETYETALASAISNIGKKRELATGQRVSFVAESAAEGNQSITVKARIKHEYWERCHDAAQRRALYHVHILCVVANHPKHDVSRVRTSRKFLRPAN